MQEIQSLSFFFFCWERSTVSAVNDSKLLLLTWCGPFDHRQGQRRCCLSCRKPSSPLQQSGGGAGSTFIWKATCCRFRPIATPPIQRPPPPHPPSRPARRNRVGFWEEGGRTWWAPSISGWSHLAWGRGVGGGRYTMPGLQNPRTALQLLDSH